MYIGLTFVSHIVRSLKTDIRRFLPTVLIGAVALPGAWSPARAGAIGNPHAANGWSSTSGIAVSASATHGGRPAIRTIDGSGIDPGGLLHQGPDETTLDPGPTMWLAGPDSGPVSRGGTVWGSHWIQFAFGQVHPLGRMLIWNYNEISNRGNWTFQGTKEVTIQYSTTGSTNPADWAVAYEGPIAKTTQWAQRDAPWYTPVTFVVDFRGAEARYVVVTAALGDDQNWAGGEAGAGWAGLSEVRFYTFAQPVISDLQIHDAIGIGFQGVSGESYRLEYALPAGPSTWADAGYSLFGSDGAMWAFDPAGYTTQKQYRIVRE